MNRRELFGVSAAALVPTAVVGEEDLPLAEEIPEDYFDLYQKDRITLKDGYNTLTWTELDEWVCRVLPRAEPLLTEVWDYGPTAVRVFLPRDQMSVTVKCLGVRRVFYPDLTGFEVFHWPETKALLRRLGYPRLFYEKDVSFSVEIGQQPTVTVKFAGSQPKDKKNGEEDERGRMKEKYKDGRPDWKTLRTKLAAPPKNSVVDTTSARNNMTCKTSAPWEGF